MGPPKSEPPLTSKGECQPVLAMVPEAKLYTAKKDKASGCEYVQPNGGGKPSWVLPGSRSVLSAQLPTRGSFVVITDPSPATVGIFEVATLAILLALAVAAFFVKDHEPAKAVEASKPPPEPKVDHAEEAAKRAEELKQHKADAQVHVENWRHIHMQSEKLRVISDVAKKKGYLEEHLAETERHVLELQRHGSELEEQLHKALEVSHDATSKMKSVQKALDDKDLEIKIAAEKANAAVAEAARHKSVAANQNQAASDALALTKAAAQDASESKAALLKAKQAHDDVVAHKSSGETDLLHLKQDMRKLHDKYTAEAKTAASEKASLEAKLQEALNKLSALEAIQNPTKSKPKPSQAKAPVATAPAAPASASAPAPTTPAKSAAPTTTTPSERGGAAAVHRTKSPGPVDDAPPDAFVGGFRS